MPLFYQILLFLHIAAGSLSLLTGGLNMILPKGGKRHQKINSDDHSDHQTSSILFQAVAREIGGISLYLYINYASAQRDKNVT